MGCKVTSDKVIAVVNYSGNVGKSTIAVEVLASHFPEVEVLSIESINDGADGSAVVVRSSQGRDVLRSIALGGQYIIDVGSGDLGQFLAVLKNEGGHGEDIDCWVVPTTIDAKVMKDTNRTIRDLRELGVDGAQIKVVLNRLPAVNALTDESQFKALKKTYGVEIVPAALKESDIYAIVRGSGKTIRDWAGDQQDYKSAARNPELSDEDREAAYQGLLRQRMATSAYQTIAQVASELGVG